ncbi:unnamed protein product [Pseudo-nitzschia multistriata]|uniref:UBX domain-containing protein n=1 Tax=Pseudo-nitzschia multistriata TaxID=183589 RepID=A0A448ZGM6_9STRA|nr:unnamed protein product [Pseudo-nitzschia multistriata]
MSASDESVSQFMAFTGSGDAERAQMYLEMSGGDLETAVGLFLEHGGGGGSGGASPGAPPLGSTGGLGGSGDVRAPDATQTMRLMDDGPGGGMPMGLMGGHPYARMGMGMGLGPQRFATTSAFARDAVNSAAGADPDDSMRSGGRGGETGSGNAEEEDEDDDSYAGSGSHADGDDPMGSERSSSGGGGGLADLFSPPVHLICNAGGFEGARASARDSKRWLLVNLQRDSEFSCHALNRDVWRDELVENLIGDGFVFWQEFDTTPEGSQYADRYKVYDYPHIGIIDPRTRRLMWKKEGWTQVNPLTAERFAEYAMDFCSRHSLDRPPQAIRPPGAASRAAKRPMHEMSEDEQLQAAMRASLQDSTGGGSDDDDDDVVIVDSSGQQLDDDSKPRAVEPSAAAAAPPPAAPPSMLEELVPFDVGPEPEKGARIQFRMPDGKRKIRRFDPSQSVKHVYAFVAQSNPEGRDGKEFTLQAGFPPKDLIGDIDSSIEACSLAGEAITVRWK